MRFLAPLATVMLAVAVLPGCTTTESSQAVVPQKVALATVAYAGPKAGVAIGRFDNRSTFGRGLFSDGVDRLGGQAKTLLITHLQQSSRFNVMDRDNMAEAAREVQLKGQAQAIKGAGYLITGDVTEFGRKEVGDIALFGILGRGKQQVAYAKVSLNVLDPITSEVVFSAQGAGEYSLANREVLGTGSTASYDSTLNGKVLDLALREAVSRLAEAIDSGALKVRL